MHENSQKLQTNTWWLDFAPKPSAHHFWSFCCCFPLIQLKNACNQSSIPSAQKPVRNENEPKMSTFSPKSFARNFGHFFCCFTSVQLKNITVNKSFEDPNHPHIIFGHFIVVSHLYVKKCTKQKNRTLNTKTYQE